MTATNFDSTLAVLSNGLLSVIVQRQGGYAADTVSAQWNLHSVVMRVDVT